VDVVGWAPVEALIKLNWARLGQLGHLRRRYLSESEGGVVWRSRAALGITWSTFVARGRWLMRLIVHASRTGSVPEAALIGAPRAVRAATKVSSSVAPPAAAR
jgi:hypothetical protein